MKLKLATAIAVLGLAVAAWAQQTTTYTFNTDTPVNCRLSPALDCTVLVGGGTVRFLMDTLDRHKFNVYISTIQFSDVATGIYGDLESTSSVTTCSPLATYTLTIDNQPLDSGGTVNSLQYLARKQKSYGRSTACLYQVLAGGTTTATLPQ